MPGIPDTSEEYDPIYPLGKPKNRNVGPPKELTQVEKDAEENWLPIPGPVGLERNKITGKVRTTSAGTNRSISYVEIATQAEILAAMRLEFIAGIEFSAYGSFTADHKDDKS